MFSFFESVNEWSDGEVPFIDLPMRIKTGSESTEDHAMRLTLVRERSAAARAKLPGTVRRLIQGRHSLESIAKWMKSPTGPGPDGTADNILKGCHVSAVAARKAMDEEEKLIREQEGHVERIKLHPPEGEHYISMSKNGADSFMIDSSGG